MPTPNPSKSQSVPQISPETRRLLSDLGSAKKEREAAQRERASVTKIFDQANAEAREMREWREGEARRERMARLMATPAPRCPRCHR